MTAPQNEATILRLLDIAEKSWAAFLLSEPKTRRTDLPELYTHVRAHLAELALRGDVHNTFPDARNLYWDEPETDLERQCLDDAFALFYFIKKDCRGQKHDAQPVA